MNIKLLEPTAKVLVLHTANLGDVISGSIVIDFLKSHFKMLEVYIRPHFQGLFASDPQIKELKSVEAEQYDLVIDLDSTKESRPLVRKVKSPHKVGMYYTKLRKLKYSFMYNEQAQKLKTGRIVRDYDPMIELLGGVPPKRPHIVQHDEPSAVQWLLDEELINKPYMAMHFSSSNPIRRLPREIIDSIILKAQNENMGVVLVGVESEEIQTVIKDFKGYPKSKNFNLKELKTILGRCRFYVGSDSGPLHLATALDKKGLGFYGATLARDYGNISEKIITMELDFDCRPCDQNKPCPYNQRCLTHFKQSDYIPKIESLINP